MGAQDGVQPGCVGCGGGVGQVCQLDADGGDEVEVAGEGLFLEEGDGEGVELGAGFEEGVEDLGTIFGGEGREGGDGGKSGGHGHSDRREEDADVDRKGCSAGEHFDGIVGVYIRKARYLASNIAAVGALSYRSSASSAGMSGQSPGLYSHQMLSRYPNTCVQATGAPRTVMTRRTGGGTGMVTLHCSRYSPPWYASTGR